MSFGTRLKRIGFDFYLVLLIGMVVLAGVLPARGAAVEVVSQVAYYAVALLFFLYGAKLNTKAVLAGIANWRLQGLVFAFTFLVFPLVGLAIASLAAPWLDDEIVTGIIYLSVLPSTVQSSIAFTSIANGNVPAAVCAASASNLAGVFLTPILVAFLLHATGAGISADAVLQIGMQILLPFVLGQVARPLVGAFIARHPRLTQIFDRGSILIIVYSAFSAGVVAGVWAEVDMGVLAAIVAIDVVLLAVIMAGTRLAGRLAKLNRADAITLFFCGSKKSLASGLPMANILFAGQTVSLIVLPLMLFHQIQLFVCAIIAQRAAQRVLDTEQILAAQPIVAAK